MSFWRLEGRLALFVWCTEKKNAVGACKDGVEVRDFGCCSTHGMCEGVVTLAFSKFRLSNPLSAMQQ